MTDKRILHFYAIINGILFLISGFGKAIDTTSFSKLIQQYGLGWLALISPMIVALEIFLGINLILLIKLRYNALIACTLILIFTISFAWAFFQNGITDCGCFGAVYSSGLPPLVSFIRNGIMMIMLLLVYLKYPKEYSKTPAWKNYLLICIMAVSIFVSGLSYSLPSSFKTKKNTHPFLNQHVTNTSLSKYVKTSPDSTYLVFCFSYTCPHCWNSIENLREYRNAACVDSLIMLGSGKSENKRIFEEYYNNELFIRDVPSSDFGAIASSVPTAFLLVQDTIKAVLKSVMPSSYIFHKNFGHFVSDIENDNKKIINQ